MANLDLDPALKPSGSEAKPGAAPCVITLEEALKNGVKEGQEVVIKIPEEVWRRVQKETSGGYPYQRELLDGDSGEIVG
jgi:hypothetical protein